MQKSSTPTHLVLPRVRTALANLKNLIWEPISELECEMTPCTERPLPQKAALSLKRVKIGQGEPWGRLFQSTWFRLQVPRSLSGKRGLYLNWRDQAEGTLYVDGQPFYGFDIAHRYVELPPRAREIWVNSICCQSAIWHPEAQGLDARGSIWQGAFLVRRNEEAWAAYHDLMVLMELAAAEMKTVYPEAKDPFRIIGGEAFLSEASALTRRLLRELDSAMNVLDRLGVAECQRFLQRLLRSLKSEPTAIRAALTGHCHIDLVWLWPETIGESKAVHSFSTVDYLMDRYNDFCFGYSQPASYEAVERREPALMRRVSKRISGKRWEAVGGMYVESDTMIPCGEALLRSFEVGQKWFKEKTGSVSEICWLPDCFGFSGCLPQLMAGFGIRYFYTNKTIWRKVTEFPYTSFTWKGLDGSEVIGHVGRNPMTCYNGTMTLAELQDAERRHLESDIHPEVLIPVGYGDGGGGPSEELLERARRFSDLARLPRASWTPLIDFFRRMNPIQEKLPLYHGEISIEYHRGVATTHSALKHLYRDAEKALQFWEAASVLKSQKPLPDPFWKRLIFAQFHDYLSGTSVREVYQEALPELQRLAADARQCAVKELQQHATHQKRCWFNPTLQPVDLWIQNKRLRLAPLSSQWESQAQAWKGVPVQGNLKGLSNGKIKVTFNHQGAITSFQGGKKVEIQSPLNELQIYEDKPSTYPAWDVDAAALCSPVIEAMGTVKGKVIVSSSHQITICFRRSLTERSHVEIYYTLFAESHELEIKYVIDWNESERMIKALFPTKYSGRFARFGAPFGSVQRPQLVSTPGDGAFYESTASRWAAVSDDSERDGLYLAAESKYGFSCKDGVLAMTLLRSPRYVGEKGEAFQAATPQSLRTSPHVAPCTDQGIHEIRVVLGHYHSDAPREQLPASVAESKFVMPLAYKGDPLRSPLLGWEGGETLIPSWAKPMGEGSWLMRWHEVQGARGKIKIHLQAGWALSVVSMSGSVLKGRSSRSATNEIEFTPYEIKTFLIHSKSGIR